MKEHKEIATKSREYQNMSKKKCTQECKKIEQLDAKKRLYRGEMQGILKHCFTLTICADYQ